MPTFVAALLAHLVGGILFGPIVARRAGVDLRAAGSGNPGATNVERLVGPRAALIVLGLDAAKGAIAVAIAAWVSSSSGLGITRGWVALAVVLGHCFPITAFTGGGKGVATALGAMLALEPRAAIAFVLTYGLVRRVSGYASVGSLAAVGCGTAIASAFSPMDALPLLTLALLVGVRHAENLRRLARGEEPKVSAVPVDLDED